MLYIGTECGSEPNIAATRLSNLRSIETGDNIPQPCNNLVNISGTLFLL